MLPRENACDVLLHGQFWVKNESRVPGRVREGDVVRAKNNRFREGNGRRFQGRRKGKEKSFCFVVVQFELIFRHPCFYVVCACIGFFGEVGHFTERSGFLELCVICEKLMVYRVVSYDIEERRSVQDEENGHSTEPWGTPYMSCDGDEDELLTKVDWYLSERYDWNHWSAVDWMPKTEFRREWRIWWSVVSKAAERSNKRRTELLSLLLIKTLDTQHENSSVLSSQILPVTIAGYWGCYWTKCDLVHAMFACYLVCMWNWAQWSGIKGVLYSSVYFNFLCHLRLWRQKQQQTKTNTQKTKPLYVKIRTKGYGLCNVTFIPLCLWPWTVPTNAHLNYWRDQVQQGVSVLSIPRKRMAFFCNNTVYRDSSKGSVRLKVEMCRKTLRKCW